VADDIDPLRSRVADSIELSLKLADGLVVIAAQQRDPQPATRDPQPAWEDTLYSEKHACPIHPSAALEELEPRLFSFNSPYGACPSCLGLGTRFEFDPDLIVGNPELSLADGAIEPWRKNGKRMNIHYNRIIRRFCKDFKVSPQTSFKKLSKVVQRIVLHGTNAKDETKFGTSFEGVVPNLQRRFDHTDSEFVKHRLSGYLSESPCDACEGARLRPEALHVFLKRRDGETERRRDEVVGRTADVFANADDLPKTTQLLNMSDIVGMTIEHAAEFFDSLELDSEQQQIAAPILKEIRARLGFMLSVGLGYLNLNRATGSLSGGEAQRIRLATQVGSGLVGCCYVLDEPTIGLHQRDNDRLIDTLRHLTDIGNTVVVVEHDEDTILAADHLIDIGPGPGRHGGQVIAQGSVEQVRHDPHSLTGKYLSGAESIAVPDKRRKLKHKQALTLKGAAGNNLTGVDVAFPLGGLIVVTGVSGSGKSTLVNQTLLRAVKRELLSSRVKPAAYDKLTGVKGVDRVIEVDQSPIGRTPRSNPATYTGVFDSIRTLFTKTKEAKVRGYKPGRFSFNVKGGRCEACQGQGTKKIEMHFLPDVFVQCDVCKGKRYNRETLEITYRGKNISDVLDMTVEEGIEFFDAFSDVKRLLTALYDVGLSYVQLGQASTTLSGGEAQRVKLATELGKRSTGHTLYVLDEPTTGLHFEDVRKLIGVLNRLAEAGNTLVVIEHNMDVIKCADWLIDMGPEGGDRGGRVVAEGTPEDVAGVDTSYTGQFLRRYLGLDDAVPQAA
jgi:excinuclease ABC subunit A